MLQGVRYGSLATLGLMALVGVLLGAFVMVAMPERSEGGEETPQTRRLEQMLQRLAPLHKPLGQPQPGDWLAVHEEKGQTFREYLQVRPVRPTRERRTIVIQPLGEFTASQRAVVEKTAAYMALYFGLPVETAADLALDLVPESARRVHPEWGDRQILTTFVLDELLRPRMPKQAAVYMCLTAHDLWPGKDWNFVFGQASLYRRTGVQSMYRSGDPDESSEAFALCLRRTLHTATHETAHMFSLRHCITANCNMNGSNSRQESDRRPLWLCHDCAAKICWAMDLDPVKRYEGLADWCEANGLSAEAAFYRECLTRLGEER